jgi:hypothetical protein
MRTHGLPLKSPLPTLHKRDLQKRDLRLKINRPAQNVVSLLVASPLHAVSGEGDAPKEACR